MNIVDLVEKEIRAWWLTGGKLEEILALCPQDHDIRQFVTNEFVFLEMKMRSNPVIRYLNAEGPLRLQ